MPGQQAKHWQFTLNNPNDDERERIYRCGEAPTTAYLIVGEEVGASGTPHLQGHVSFIQRTRFSQVKDRISDRAHLEVVRLLSKHIDYCKKDGDYREFGTPPKSALSKSGERDELAEFRSTVASGVFGSPELREEHPNVMARYPNFARAVVRDLFPERECPDLPLRAWQQLVVEIAAGPVDPRKVYFVVDRKGNAGKSYLARFLRKKYEEVQVLKPGKLNDMALLYRLTTRILVIDVPRSKTEALQYGFIESVKDGLLLSGKYESQMKSFEPPHVFVFMNDEPDPKALSEDRYEYITPL